MTDIEKARSAVQNAVAQVALEHLADYFAAVSADGTVEDLRKRAEFATKVLGIGVDKRDLEQLPTVSISIDMGSGNVSLDRVVEVSAEPPLLEVQEVQEVPAEPQQVEVSSIDADLERLDEVLKGI